jgi:undecaprenyl diphosphate synthase
MSEDRYAELAKTLKRENLPNHVAIIMDGNGRWAKKQGRPRLFGHRKGAQSVRAVVEAAGELGIKVLSLFAFSEENWGRPSTEVVGIMTLLNTYLVQEREELMRHNVQLRTMGRLERLPPKSLTLIRETEEMLRNNTGLVLNIALSYGGRADIVEACRKIAQNVADGVLNPQDITQEVFASHLSCRGLPLPDLLIRTSGEQRLSNFMLWELAYAELYFTPVMWPDFNKEQLALALHDYLGRQRRFGLLNDDASIPPPPEAREMPCSV